MKMSENQQITQNHDKEDLALVFKKLTVANKNKPILFEVSGYVKRGCITAVMGDYYYSI